MSDTPFRPPAKTLLADRGYDSNWFRLALAERGIAPCIPSTRSRKQPIPYDQLLYRQRDEEPGAAGGLGWGCPSLGGVRLPPSRSSGCPYTPFKATPSLWMGGRGLCRTSTMACRARSGAEAPCQQDRYAIRITS